MLGANLFKSPDKTTTKTKMRKLIMRPGQRQIFGVVMMRWKVDNGEGCYIISPRSINEIYESSRKDPVIDKWFWFFMMRLNVESGEGC